VNSRGLLAFDGCRGVMDKLSGDFIEVTRRVSTPQKLTERRHAP